MIRTLFCQLALRAAHRRVSYIQFAVTVVAVVFLAFGTMRLFDSTRPRGSALVLDYRTSVSGTIQVFYDLGRGLREQDSSMMMVRPSDRFQQIRLELGAGRLVGLRLDPLDRAGAAVMAHLRVVRPGEADIPLAPQAVRPGQQIASLRITGDNIAVQTVDRANDPILNIDLPEPIQTFAEAGLLAKVRIFCICLALWTALVWLVWWFSSLRINRVTPQRQEAVVAMAAALGAILACMPIIFLHQSLLAPDRSLFYDACPFVADMSDCRRIDVHGADVSAMAVAFLPGVVVQEHAVRRFGEFPLWNRYDSTGVSMIGQGQLMLGDPFTWVQWLIGVDAWSFDAKFIVLRIVFAAALGLAVLTISGALLPSVMVAISAPFIGFFLYRVDHPAIFTLCYAPLISLAWLRLTYPSRPRSRFWWLVGLMAANWLVLNSGTVKESYATILILNSIGVIHFLVDGWRAGHRLFRITVSMLLISGVSFAMITLPVVGTFIETLGKSATNYDVPVVQQLAVWKALIFVDSYFSLLVSGQYLPAVNALLVAGFSAAILCIANCRENRVRNSILIYTISTAIIFAMVFSIIPSSWLLAIPFIRNIYHIDTTFSTALIIPMTIAAGLGFHLVEIQIARNEIGPILIGVGTVFTFLCFFFVLGFATHGGLLVRNFVIYATIVLSAAVFAPWLIVKLANGGLSPFGVTLCILALLFTLGRGAYYPPLRLGSSFFEPGQRISLVTPPAIAERLRATLSKEPARVIGFYWVFVPGYNAAIGLETITGPDAVMVRRYRELALALHLPYDQGGWYMVFDTNSLAAARGALDLLGVKYIVASDSNPVPGLTRVDDDSRVSVYRRDTAWPRAFFSDRVEILSSLPDFARRIQGNTGPFVAIARTDGNAMKLASRFAEGNQNSQQIVGAYDYALTENSTSFTIKAPSPGVVYIAEADIPGDFTVTVDGTIVPYFSANYAFKAIGISRAGTYRVTFSYRPAHLAAFLWVALVGLLLWFGALGWFRWYLQQTPYDVSRCHRFQETR
jgi:hypothetical protein